jgi:ATP-binding protein involved in chromosome partitioning
MDLIKKKMSGVRNKIAVMSGKGGVGKSTVSANIALCLALKGLKTGLIDSDFHGPSIPKILGLQGKRLLVGKEGIIPVPGPLGIKVVSMAFLMEDKESLTWVDEFKRGALEEFLASVNFGSLDYLVLDLPPGTGAETLNLMKYIPDLTGVLIVTIPSEVSQDVARRGVSICLKAQVPILGIIENMSGFVCPDCGRKVNIFQAGGGEKLAQELNIPFLGNIPLEEKISRTADNGTPFILQFPESISAQTFLSIAERILSSS